MSFFKKSPSGLEHVVARSASMLGDARHSFDLATLALLTETDWASVESDIRATDQRINHTEQELRSELVVHVTIQGAADIGSVLGMILLLKKIERIGDQAGNVLDLAESGVQLSDQADTDALLAERGIISTMFGEAAELLSDPADERIDSFSDRCQVLANAQQAKIEECLHSALPGKDVVPRAIYYRYLKRIIANLVGIVRTANEPLPTIDYLDNGETDTDD
ncbi:MAG: PhoU domain-containing protein [Ilumatobacter sp.]|nr:PhoU domain-containing protein [Ilumatobacter sp.]MDG2040881.1 PhoU domain-containing protein [Ilumatobacter sp.]